MEEARTGLSKDGGSIYLANYISEQGNVHKLVEKLENKLIIPIIKGGIPTWDRYSVEDIKLIEKEADDFAGEYLCRPDASKDIYFDREILDKMEVRQPIKEVAEKNHNELLYFQNDYPELLERKVSELNIKEQVLNICKSPIIQK